MKGYTRLCVSGVHGSSPCLARHINPLKVRLFQSSFLRKALIGDFALQAAFLVECQIYTATRRPHPDTYETLTAARATSARS